MSALDRLIPLPRLLERHHVEVAAPPERAWPVVRHLDLGRSRLVRALFSMRTLAERREHKNDHLKSAPGPLTVDALRSTPERPGFQLLVDQPPHEFAVGAIGQVWHLDIPFRHVADAETFRGFSGPGFAKVAWAVRIDRLGQTGSRIEVEVRVDATDEASWTKFERYFRVIGPASRMIRRVLLASLRRQLGSLDAIEEARALPGDELLPDATAQVTDAITLHATPDRIWPWLVQMGGRRAGFYSYQWLENVAGCGLRNAETIHPEWALRVGDALVLHPKVPPFPIVESVPGRYLVAAARADETKKRERQPWVDASWAFFVEPLGPHRSRVISRYRCATSGDLFTRITLGRSLVEPIGFAMDRRMLLGIKERAERRRPRSVPPPSVVWTAIGAVAAAVAAWAFWPKPERLAVTPRGAEALQAL